jgi:hypothetical protein
MHELQTLGGLTIEHDPANHRPVQDGVGQLRAPLDTMPASSFSSSNVHSGLYDFGEQELYVRYLRDGPDAIYRYTAVPPSEWQGLKDAGSKGSYINARIAYNYGYTKLSSSDFPERGRGLQNGLARQFVTAHPGRPDTA